MIIKKFVIGKIRTNCYLIYSDKIKEAIIIDPADESKSLQDFIISNELKITAILITHGHFDHISGINMIKSINKDVKVYASKNEEEILSSPDLNLSSRFTRKEVSINDYIKIKDEGKLNIKNFEIEVIFTPGHTIGGVSYYFKNENALFSGDTIFHHLIGRTDFPTGNYDMLINSINKVFGILDESTIIYPGHDIETTIKEEKIYNPYINAENI